jgi:hypothetical protein
MHYRPASGSPVPRTAPPLAKPTLAPFHLSFPFPFSIRRSKSIVLYDHGRMRWLAPALLLTGALSAATLKPETSEAFDHYIRQRESSLAARKNFLWADQSPTLARRVESGEIVVESAGPNSNIPVKNGLIHDWIGSAFLPGITIDQTIALVRDYNHHQKYYAPEVMEARILSHTGNDYRIFLRLLKKQVLTVILDTEHEVHYTQLDAKRWQSRSQTAKISELDHGQPQPPGTGHGFLWRLNSYWRFEERSGGTWIECEAVSLTRDVPIGLGWLIRPMIHNLPRESLANTLMQTRIALLQ